MKLPTAASLPTNFPNTSCGRVARSLQLMATPFPTLLASILLIAGVPHALAEKPDEVETRISLLAVGTPPLPYYEFRNGQRHVFDTANSEYPPAQVHVREKRGDNESFKPVSLGLNIPTGYITYRGQRKLVLFRDDEDAQKSVFASIDIPELRDDLTLILVRDRHSKSWEKPPQVHAFDNSLAAFPNDSVRLINLSPLAVRARINDGRVLEIAVNRSTVVRIPRKDQGILSYRIAAVHDGRIYPLIDTATTTMPDTRFNLVVYKSDSATARAPVDIASFFERPPQKDAE